MTSIDDESEVRGPLFAMIPEWVLYSKEIGPNAVRAYGVLARFANHDSRMAWPSRASISELANCSLPTLDKALAELVDIGAVIIEHRYIEADGKDGKTKRLWTSSLYTLTGFVEKLDVKKSTPPLVNKNEKGSQETNVGTRAIEPELYEQENYNDVSDVKELCDLLQKHVVANGFKPFVEGKSSLAAMERLLRIDQRTPEQVRYIIEWCQKDEFWLGNIRSPQKLRDKFDTLFAQATRGYRGVKRFLEDDEPEGEFKWG